MLTIICKYVCIGMFSGQIVDLLLLDADAENKDKKNAENLIQNYKALMNNDGEAKQDKAGEFFSTQINLYTFVPDYSKDTSKQFTLFWMLKVIQKLIND